MWPEQENAWKQNPTSNFEWHLLGVAWCAHPAFDIFDWFCLSTFWWFAAATFLELTNFSNFFQKVFGKNKLQHLRLRPFLFRKCLEIIAMALRFRSPFFFEQIIDHSNPFSADQPYGESWSLFQHDHRGALVRNPWQKKKPRKHPRVLGHGFWSFAASSTVEGGDPTVMRVNQGKIDLKYIGKQQVLLEKSRFKKPWMILIYKIFFGWVSFGRAARFFKDDFHDWVTCIVLWLLRIVRYYSPTLFRMDYNTILIIL